MLQIKISVIQCSKEKFHLEIVFIKAYKNNFTFENLFLKAHKVTYLSHYVVLSLWLVLQFKVKKLDENI